MVDGTRSGSSSTSQEFQETLASSMDRDSESSQECKEEELCTYSTTLEETNTELCSELVLHPTETCFTSIKTSELSDGWPVEATFSPLNSDLLEEEESLWSDHGLEELTTLRDSDTMQEEDTTSILIKMVDFVLTAQEAEILSTTRSSFGPATMERTKCGEFMLITRSSVLADLDSELPESTGSRL